MISVPEQRSSQLRRWEAIMIEFFWPTSRALCPLLVQIAQMGLILPRWLGGLADSIFAQNTTTYPCSLLSSHQPLARIRTYTKHPQPHPPKTLFPSLNLPVKVGKMSYHLGNVDLNWAKCLKSGQNCSGSVQK